jgi:YceI-like protein
MRRQSRTIAVALAGLLPLALGMRYIGTPIDVQPESRLWVRGTSSTRAWECKATSFEAVVQSGGAGAVASILSGDKAVGEVAVTIPTEKLECGNGTMNGHMRKALKADAYPQIAFTVQSYEIVKSGDSVQVDLKGQLTLGGVQKDVTIKAAATVADNGALRVIGTYDLRMTDYGLKPPSLMFGTMKVGDQVKVSFDMLLKDRTQ